MFKIADRVYILSEMGFDTDFFNERAFNNLLALMKMDKNITGILIDGAVTRLDRPEILNELLTYWNKTEAECDEASETIPYHKQYQHMLNVQMGILKTYLSKIQSAVPEASIVLCIPTDDTHFSLSALIAELLRYRKSEISDSIKSIMLEIKEILNSISSAQKEIEEIKNDHFKKNTRREQTLKQIIDENQKKLAHHKKELEEEQVSLSLFRTKKSRPEHQQRTHEFVGFFLKAYSDLCNDLHITLVTHSAILKFDSMIIDYAHSRHPTWTIIKGRDKQLVISKHGRLNNKEINRLVDMIINRKNNQNIKVDNLTLETLLENKNLKKHFLKEVKKERIDVILETGHHGIGFKQTQRISDLPEETNFQNQASYSPVTSKENITFVIAPPFEDQEAISIYKNGGKPARMKIGIPLNTTNSEVFKRYDSGAVSGLCILQKYTNGTIHTEWIQYSNFIDGSVLNQPKEYAAIFASSDEHKGSPEENLSAQDGFLQLYKQTSAQPFSFRGRRAFAKGYINGGDAGEANSRKWNYRYHRRPDPQTLLPKIIKMLGDFKKDNIKDIYNTSMQLMSYSLSGSVESMRDVLQRIANYFMSFFEVSIKRSQLQCLHVSVPGNHADDVLKDVGLKDTDFFVERIQTLGYDVYEVGIDQHFTDSTPRKARVFIGGYSNARIINIKSYGLDVDGKPMFGPINLLVQHDPKGSGFTGIIDAGKSVNADLTIAGHTHENYMKLYKTGSNTFSVALRLATLQGVTPTEKYYAGGVPRTQAGHWFIMPMVGDFAEMAIPSIHLNSLGETYVKKLIKKFFKKTR